MAQARVHQFRWPGGPDRADASRSGGEAALDFREPIPARAQLLHAPARPRGAATRDLYRLADARQRGRVDSGQPVRAALTAALDQPELDLPGIRAATGGCGNPLRGQTSGYGHRLVRRLSHRNPGAPEWRIVEYCRAGFRGDLSVRLTVSADRSDSRTAWRLRWPGRATTVRIAARTRVRRPALRAGIDRR